MGLLTDTHCHLNLPIFQADLPVILERAWERGLERILIPGIDVESSRLALQLCDQYPNLYAAVGIHPGSASSWNDQTYSTLRELAQHPKTVAIGEIGLDYYRDRSPQPLQRETFHKQLQLANDLNMPIIVHNRDAFEDVWCELLDWQTVLTQSESPIAQKPGVLHSFDGTISEALQAVEKGFFIGISGPVTFRNAAERHQTAAQLPLDHILIETDAPYLTPHPFRGQRNEPAYVALVADKISELHHISPDVVARVTWNNANMIFQWEANF